MNKFKTKKLAVAAILFFVLASALFLAKPAAAQTTLPTITIQQDGNISPNTAAIHQSGNTYTFTTDIYGAINILRSNIVIDGAGYTLQGSFNGNKTDIWVVGTGPDPTMAYYTIGVDLGSSTVGGVTVENLNVENFSIGMYIWTKNNTIVGNDLSGCIVGLLMSGSNSTISRNYISCNIEGLFFGFNSPSGQFPPDMVVYQNAFLKNNVQISGCQCKSYNMSETLHNWDKGKIGNYWSDYNGTDSNHDGVGDSPYIIDPLDKDSYPLMQIPVKPPLPAIKTPELPVVLEAAVLGISVSAVSVSAVFAANRRRRLKA
ncbi:MAG TPA: NosD domain-containing protein [Candidatus Acidoferrales bacterium]|nr:NosD domain-containing protein [Candidatus Acidoferrales bacterium]